MSAWGYKVLCSSVFRKAAEEFTNSPNRYCGNTRFVVRQQVYAVLTKYRDLIGMVYNERVAELYVDYYTKIMSPSELWVSHFPWEDELQSESVKTKERSIALLLMAEIIEDLEEAD